MKNLLLLIFLIPFFGISQNDIKGNTIFSKEQEAKFIERYNNPQITFPSTVTGFSNEVGHISRGATEFFQDMSDFGAGGDRGGWYPTADMVVDGSTTNPFQPFGSTYGEPRTLFNIHFAALDAVATQNTGKALLVFEELQFLSQIVYLDFSNETVFDKTQRGYQNPVFYAAAKMNSYRTSYSLIHDLVKNTAYYNANKDIVNAWFLDAKDYFKSVIDNNMDYWIVDGDWRAENDALTIRLGTLEDYYTHYDATGTTGVNEISDFQFNTMNNRVIRLVSYVTGYGLSFDNEQDVDWGFDFFKFTLKNGQFADNTFHEQARGAQVFPGGSTRPATEGVDYTWDSYFGLIKIAVENEVAVANGILDSDKKGRFFDYTTSIGTDQTISNYTGYSSTSGGDKNIKNGVYNLSKYYNGEFQRYTEDALIIYPDEHTFSVATSMVNTYYNEQDLEDFYLFNIIKNYPPADKSDRAFAVRPSNFGIGIGVGAAQGGIVGYGKVDNSYGVTGDGSQLTGVVLKQKEEIKAFPKAYGGGAVATGGRGGVVYLVNTLNYKEPAVFNTGVNGGNDYWTGGIYDAINNKTIGDRYVIFDVSGISVGDVPDVYDRNDPNYVSGQSESGLFVKVSSNYTILGQTAPMGGFTITKTWLQMDRVNNVILRHFKARPNLLRLSGDDVLDSQLDSGIRITGQNTMIDHCESSFSGDKGVLVGSSEVGYAPINITVQNTMAIDNATSMFSSPNTPIAERELGNNISWFYNASASSHRAINTGGLNGYVELQNNFIQINADVAIRIGNNNYSEHSVGYLGNVYDVVNTVEILQNKVQTGSPTVYAQGNIYRNDEGIVLSGFSGENQEIMFGDFSTSASLPESSFSKTSFYKKIPNAAPLLSAIEAYAKILNEVGANRYVTDTGKLGFYRDDYTTEALEKMKRREGFQKKISFWNLPTIEPLTRPSNYYGDIKGIPLWFVEKFNITSIHEVIDEYIFDDFVYNNEAGYPAIEVFSNYVAGDIQPYNVYRNLSTKDVVSIKTIPNPLDLGFTVGMKNNVDSPIVLDPQELNDGDKLTYQQTGLQPIQFAFKDDITDLYFRTSRIGGVAEVSRVNGKLQFRGDVEVNLEPLEDVYLEENSLSYFSENSTSNISSSNSSIETELTDLPPDANVALRLTTTNGTSGNLNESVGTFLAGEKLRISFWAKNDVDAGGRIILWTNVVTRPNQDLTDDWALYSFDVEVDQDGSVATRVYITPSSANGSILVSGLRCQKIYE